MSERKISFWLHSGANIHACRKVRRTFCEIGVEEDVWDSLTEDEKEKIAKEICFEQADWGWAEE